MCTGLLPAPGPLPLADAQVVPLGHEAGAGGWILPPAGSPCPCPQEGPGGRLSSCEAGAPSGCPWPGLAAWGSRQCSSRAGPGRPGHARWWGRWLRTAEERGAQCTCSAGDEVCRTHWRCHLLGRRLAYESLQVTILPDWTPALWQPNAFPSHVIMASPPASGSCWAAKRSQHGTTPWLILKASRAWAGGRGDRTGCGDGGWTPGKWGSQTRAWNKRVTPSTWDPGNPLPPNAQVCGNMGAERRKASILTRELMSVSSCGHTPVSPQTSPFQPRPGQAHECEDLRAPTV